jgi:hypothetical protein
MKSLLPDPMSIIGVPPVPRVKSCRMLTLSVSVFTEKEVTLSVPLTTNAVAESSVSVKGVSIVKVDPD